MEEDIDWGFREEPEPVENAVNMKKGKINVRRSRENDTVNTPSLFAYIETCGNGNWQLDEQYQQIETTMYKMGEDGEMIENEKETDAPGKLIRYATTVDGRRTEVMIDSGASRDFISTDECRRLNLHPEKSNIKMRVKLADGSTLNSGETAVVPIRIGEYIEARRLHVLPMRGLRIVLGMPWLKQRGVVANFGTGVLEFRRDGTRHVFTPQQQYSINEEHMDLVDHVTMMESVQAGDTVYVAQVLSKEAAENREEESLISTILEDGSVLYLDHVESAKTEESRTQAEIAEEAFRETIKVDELLDKEKYEAVLEIIKEFPEVATPMTELPPIRKIGSAPPVVMEIKEVPGAVPQWRRVNERMPLAHVQEMKKQIEELTQKGYIRPSNSPYGAPVLFAPKKDGGLRMCLDYRQLNAQTIKDKYPLPRDLDCFDQFRGANWITALDCLNGYYVVPIHEDSIHKTAIRTQLGSFEWLVMPFGLTNAPSVYQRMIESILGEYIADFVMVFLDDIAIYTKGDEKLHMEHIRKVLSALGKHKLKIKLSKCAFFRKEVSYLGHVVSGETVKPDEKKIQTIRDWKEPQTNKELQSFIGLANYYHRMIERYAEISAPLTDIMAKTWGKSNRDEYWTKRHTAAFKKLQQALCSEPLILHLPDISKGFIVNTDASLRALGGVLMQEGEEPGERRVVAYCSKKFSDTERNWPTHERELFAFVYAFRKWKHYLIGTTVKIESDHKPLTWLKTQKTLTAKQARWLERLEEFDWEIQYIPGKDMVVSDAISRKDEEVNVLQEDLQEQKRSGYHRHGTSDMFGWFPYVDKHGRRRQRFGISHQEITESNNDYNVETHRVPRTTMSDDRENGRRDSTNALPAHQPEEPEVSSTIRPRDEMPPQLEEELRMLADATPRKGDLMTYLFYHVDASNEHAQRPGQYLSYMAKEQPYLHSTLDAMVVDGEEDETELLASVQDESNATQSSKRKRWEDLIYPHNNSTSMSTWTSLADWAERLKVAYSNDEFSRRTLRGEGTDSNYFADRGFIFTQSPATEFPVVWVPSTKYSTRLIHDIIQEFHSVPLAGHLSKDKTLEKLQRYWKWDRMVESVERFIENCLPCKKSKRRVTARANNNVPYPIPDMPWEVVAMDAKPINRAAPTKRGNTGVWIFICKLTRRAHIVPIDVRKGEMDSRKLAEIYMDHVVRHHGVPKRIISDQDPLIMARFWKELHNIIGTKLNLATTHHAVTDGGSERYIQTITGMLRAFAHENPESWDNYVSAVEFAYNDSVHPYTGYTPFQLDMGRDPNTPMSILMHGVIQRPALYHGDDIRIDASEFMRRWSMNIHWAKQHLKSRQIVQHTQLQRRSTIPATFYPGDYALVETNKLKPKAMEERYTGPYKILSRAGENTYEVDYGSANNNPIVNVSRMRSYGENAVRNTTERPDDEVDPLLNPSPLASKLPCRTCEQLGRNVSKCIERGHTARNRGNQPPPSRFPLPNLEQRRTHLMIGDVRNHQVTYNKDNGVAEVELLVTTTHYTTMPQWLSAKRLIQVVPEVNWKIILSYVKGQEIKDVSPYLSTPAMHYRGKNQTALVTGKNSKGEYELIYADGHVELVPTLTLQQGVSANERLAWIGETRRPNKQNAYVALDVCSGTKSFQKALHQIIPNAKVYTLDIDCETNPTFCADIRYWKPPENLKPGTVTVLWLSPPCDQYSRAKTTGERDLKTADEVAKACLELIDTLKPKHWILENPTGLLRTRPFMKRYLKYLKPCTYCKYDSPEDVFDYRKETDIFTNIEVSLQHCRLCPCKYKQDKGCHPRTAQRGPSHGGTPGCSKEVLHRVPKLLIQTLLTAASMKTTEGV